MAHKDPQTLLTGTEQQKLPNLSLSVIKLVSSAGRIVQRCFDLSL